MNSYATGISEIIPSGGLSNRASLEVKVKDLIYYQQGTVKNYELFLSKLGNHLFYRSCKQAFIKSISQKIHILKNITATKILLIEQNSAGYTGKKVLTPWTYIHLWPLPHHTPSVPCAHLEVQHIAEIFLRYTFQRYTFHIIQFLKTVKCS